MRRDSRRSSLEEALLGVRPWRYIWYRQQYLVLSQLFLFFLFLLEINFFYPVFAQKKIVSSILIYNLTHLALWFWWGGLELFRDRVRDFILTGNQMKLQRELNNWASLSLQIGIVIAAIAISVFVYQAIFGFKDQRLFYSFICILLFKLAIQIPTRTIYSGILATTRVYRPIYSIILADVIYLIIIVALWHFLNVWAFVIALLFSSMVSALLTIYFCLRVYKIVKVPLPRIRFRIRLEPIRLIFTKKFMSAGFAFAATRLGNILVVAIVLQTIMLSGGDTRMLMFAQAATPLINAGAGWAQLFYFDFKKLNSKLLQRFQIELAKKLVVVSLLVGLCVWFMCVFILQAFYKLPGPEILFGALLALLLRSAVSVYHVRLFTEGRFWSMAASSLIMFLALVPAEGNIIWRVCLALLLTLIFLETFPGYATKICKKIWPQKSHILSPTNALEWLQSLEEIGCQVQLGKLLFHKERPWSLKTVLADIQKQIGANGAAVALGRTRILWYQTDGEIDVKPFMVRLGGLVSEFAKSDVFLDGKKCFDFLINSGWLGTLNFSEMSSGKNLETYFRDLFSNGLVITPKRLSTTSTQPLSMGDSKNILREALHFCSLTPLQSKKNTFDVSAYCIKGVIQMIFAVPRAIDTISPRAEWRGRLKALNIASLFLGDDHSVSSTLTQ